VYEAIARRHHPKHLFLRKGRRRLIGAPGLVITRDLITRLEKAAIGNLDSRSA
jgi:hypothetical protein